MFSLYQVSHHRRRHFFFLYLVQTWFQSCTPEYTNSLAFFPVSAAKYVYHTEAIFMYASNDTPSISTKAQEFLTLTVKIPYFDTIQN